MYLCAGAVQHGEKEWDLSELKGGLVNGEMGHYRVHWIVWRERERERERMTERNSIVNGEPGWRKRSAALVAKAVHTDGRR